MALGTPDPASLASAKAAGLRWGNDTIPGIERLGSGKSFRYVSPSGKAIHDEDELRRIKSLAIPPAWTDVWICPAKNGHLQASGRDVKGRKQYRYHPKWRQARDETKFEKMMAFGKALSGIRARIAKDLARPGLPREKVLATVIALLEKTLIRVGNEEYARTNKSFGLTTLRDQHVQVKGGTARFHFRGKSGVEHAVDLDDRRIAKVVKMCQDLPGQELFQYLDDEGVQRDVDSSDVNSYLQEIAGADFSAKDFRTWAGTVLAAQALQELGEFTSGTRGKKNVLAAVDAVAKRLGNTRSVCRKCYVHPAIVDAYLDGSMVKTLKARASKALKTAAKGLPKEELAVLVLLERRLRSDAKQKTECGMVSLLKRSVEAERKR